MKSKRGKKLIRIITEKDGSQNRVPRTRMYTKRTRIKREKHDS